MSKFLDYIVFMRSTPEGGPRPPEANGESMLRELLRKEIEFSRIPKPDRVIGKEEEQATVLHMIGLKTEIDSLSDDLWAKHRSIAFAKQVFDDLSRLNMVIPSNIPERPSPQLSKLIEQRESLRSQLINDKNLQRRVHRVAEVKRELERQIAGDIKPKTTQPRGGEVFITAPRPAQRPVAPGVVGQQDDVRREGSMADDLKRAREKKESVPMDEATLRIAAKSLKKEDLSDKERRFVRRVFVNGEDASRVAAHLKFSLRDRIVLLDKIAKASMLKKLRQETGSTDEIPRETQGRPVTPTAISGESGELAQKGQQRQSERQAKKDRPQDEPYIRKAVREFFDDIFRNHRVLLLPSSQPTITREYNNLTRKIFEKYSKYITTEDIVAQYARYSPVAVATLRYIQKYPNLPRRLKKELQDIAADEFEKWRAALENKS